MAEKSLIAPLRSKMEQFSELGVESVNDGVALYGKAPFVGPKAFLHTIYPPLSSEGIVVLESEIGVRLPGQLVDFYRECNGLHYFVDTLTFYGLRSKAGRNSAAFYQPYDLKTPNVEERIRGAQDEIIFFAWYDWDGSFVYTKTSDSKIYFCRNDSTTPLKEWPSLRDFIADESERISKLFDEKGQPIDETASTLPV
ncbi:SMI1/KNR4 family protein [Burkholderia sp. Ax-1719]|uniref:SMI1/KNR4 family protein n=1 Tax=Burkholderia sp. Ax-1719 TaxID=2608334 RepID=UPI001420237F|nr:SMI1/KNR4 family protein [Burkholderia sp. Ax-1719]NIE63551.1 SMI1/KNR4 family protein [Burkholderia sp. Ax-1719]